MHADKGSDYRLYALFVCLPAYIGKFVALIAHYYLLIFSLSCHHHDANIAAEYLNIVNYYIALQCLPKWHYFAHRPQYENASKI